MRKPIINTIWQIVGKAMMVGLGLVTTGMLTRDLGPGVYGGYMLIVSSFVILDAVTDMGTKIIGIRELAKEEDKKRRLDILGQIVWMRLMTGTVAYVVGLMVVLWWDVFALVRPEAVLALTMLWLTLFGGIWEVVYQVEMRMDLKVLQDILFPFLMATGIYLMRNSLSLMMVFEISILARMISLLVGLRLISKLIMANSLWVIVDWRRIREIWKMSWPMGVYLLVFAAYDRGVDSMMVGKLVGLKEVAWYGLAYKIYTTLLQPAYFFVTATFPLMAANNIEKKKLFARSMGLLLVGVVCLIIGTEILAPWVVYVLGGEEFYPAVPVLRILILASLFSYLSHLFGFTLIARGGQKEMLKLGIVALIINLTFNFVFIQKYGIYGAAWVTVLTELVGMLGMGYFLYKNTKLQKVTSNG